MRILFDQGTPVPLRHHLPGHSVATAHEMGWSTMENGDLLRAADHDFDLLVTTDQNLPYQHNLAGMRLAVLVLPFASWPRLRDHIAVITAAIESIEPGHFRNLAIP